MKRISIFYYTLFFLKMTSLFCAVQPPPRRLHLQTPPNSPYDLSFRSSPSTPLLPHPAATYADFEHPEIDLELEQIFTPRVIPAPLARPVVRSQCPCQSETSREVDQAEAAPQPSKGLRFSRRALLTGSTIGSTALMVLAAQQHTSRVHRGLDLNIDGSTAFTVASVGLGGLSSLLHTSASVAGTGLNAAFGSTANAAISAAKIGLVLAVVITVKQSVSGFNGWLHKGCKEHEKVQDLECQERVREVRMDEAAALHANTQRVIDHLTQQTQQGFTTLTEATNHQFALLARQAAAHKALIDATRADNHMTRQQIAQICDTVFSWTQRQPLVPAGAASAAAAAAVSIDGPVTPATTLQEIAQQARAANAEAQKTDQAVATAATAQPTETPAPVSAPQIAPQQIPLKQKTACDGCCEMM